MRPVAPYVGIAVAVAIGVALAPYLGWIVVWTVAGLAVCVALALLRRGVRRIRASLRSRRTLV